MNTNTFLTIESILLIFIIILQDIKIVGLNKKIKELKHFIDMFGKDKEIP